MKQIVTERGRFGPYAEVVTLDDRYRADGADLPFAVVGQVAVGEWEGALPKPEPQPITREAAKAARQAAVDAIRVTTSTGKTFDGDETSQTRMSRALIGMQAAGIPAIVWALADNTLAEVSAAELTEALLLAGQEQARLWPLDQWGFAE